MQLYRATQVKNSLKEGDIVMCMGEKYRLTFIDLEKGVVDMISFDKSKGKGNVPINLATKIV